MFRLIKLAAVALFGYALYEFIRGITNDPQVRSLAREAAGAAQNAARESIGGRFNESSGQNITGPGRGAEVESLDNDGGSVRHKVGRGVVH